jgi:hypothetical protein
MQPADFQVRSASLITTEVLLITNARPLITSSFDEFAPCVE